MKTTSLNLDPIAPANGETGNGQAAHRENGQHKTGNFGVFRLTKKVNLPRIGAVDAVCHVDLDLMDANIEEFQQRLRMAFQAFQACDEVIKDELVRTGGAKGKDPASREQAAERLMEELLQGGEVDESPLGGKRTDDEETGGVATKAPAKAPPPKPAPKPARKLNEEELAALRKTRINYAILGGCAVTLALVWYFFWSPASVNPERLAATSLSAGDLAKRIDAVNSLAAVQEPSPVPQLRMVAEQTKDPEVLVQALNGLSARRHYQSLPLFYLHLEHPVDTVRSAAWAGVQQIQIAMPDGLEYKVDATAEERSRVARRLKELYDQRAKSRF